MSDIPFSSSETPSKSADFKPGIRVVCRVCEKQFSQYTCPRCNIRYCSLHCYKSHSLRCTESFMRENVMGELQHMQPDEGGRLRMMDILKRLHEQEETDNFDEEESSISEEIIQKLLSGTLISFDDLSIEEKKRFNRAVATGELSRLIAPWDPWWLKPSARHISLSGDGTQLVQPLELSGSSENNIKSDQLHEMPLGPETPLPSVGKLTSTAPSPFLSIHLIDIIYSYCFTLRLYNGDWKADVLEACSAFLSISSLLGEGSLPESVQEALLNCLEHTCSPAYRQIGGLHLGLRLVDDAIHILHLGGAALVCLLCDLQRMIQTAERELKLERRRQTRMVGSRSKLKCAVRKVYFFTCWVHEQPSDLWPSLAAIVKAEKASLSEHSNKNILGSAHKTYTRGKPMITEV